MGSFLEKREEEHFFDWETGEGDYILFKRTNPNGLETEPWRRFWLLESQRGLRTLDGVDPCYISNSFITHTLACFCNTPTASHLENTREKRV